MGLFPTSSSLCQGIVGSVTEAEMEVYDRVLVLLKYVKKMVNERKSSCCVKRKLMMRLRIDGYDASLCKSSWDATFGRLGGDSSILFLFDEWRNVAYSSFLCNNCYGVILPVMLCLLVYSHGSIFFSNEDT